MLLQAADASRAMLQERVKHLENFLKEARQQTTDAEQRLVEVETNLQQQLSQYQVRHIFAGSRGARGVSCLAQEDCMTGKTCLDACRLWQHWQGRQRETPCISQLLPPVAPGPCGEPQPGQGRSVRRPQVCARAAVGTASRRSGAIGGSGNAGAGRCKGREPSASCVMLSLMPLRPSSHIGCSHDTNRLQS